jgi:IMP dehydrogenase
MSSVEKEQFFETMEEQGLALTFDDVRLRTQSGASTELPPLIDIQSQFSRGVKLKVPFVSAAMDTVTSGEMAIEMAKLGGLGVIHSAMPISDQRREVRRVKKEVNGLIEEPITVNQDDSLESVLNMAENRKFNFRTFPVVDGSNKLVGLISGKDFEYPDDHSGSVSSAMTPFERILVAPEGTTIEEAYYKMQSEKRNTLPLLKDDGTVGGLYVFSDVSRIHRNIDHYNVDGNGQLISAAAVSTISPTSDTMERIGALEKYLDVVVLDTADGDSFYAFQTLDAIKADYPDLDIVVGNVSEGASARELAEHGADGIKVGQGPGSICTTRRETGIGMPQVTAVHDSIKALGKDFADVPVCADGGIAQQGDIAIAFAAGAHSVMMGRMLAGTKEAPGELFTRSDGSVWKRYRGMGSQEALQDNAASRERYGAQGGVFLPEGVSAQVGYEGPVEGVLSLCVLALRKSMRYVKAPDLTYLRESTNLRRITNAGLRESHPHDVDTN